MPDDDDLGEEDIEWDEEEGAPLFPEAAVEMVAS